MLKSVTAPTPETKAANLRKLLTRKAGADLAALQSATGWQPHSVRAALSRLRKAGFTIDQAGAAKSGDSAIYRITGGPDGSR